MKLAKPLRFVLVCLLGLVLAIGLVFLSGGIALTHKAPETAVTMFPLNGLAQERLASAVFTSSVATSGKPKDAAKSAEALARSSFYYEPLTPTSHAILALALNDDEARAEVVRLSSKLNRRDATLQALVLQGYVETGNYEGVVKTLDGILRVSPSKSQELFPILLNVFVQDGAVKEFAKILDGSSPWHRKFIRFAVRQPTALSNLVELRPRLSFGDDKLDHALLINLANQGDFDAAYGLYRQFTKAGRSQRVKESLSWVSMYEPFDWSFADDAELRAQTSLKTDELELYVRPGHGGTFAKRIISTPSAPFSVSAEHQISPRNLSKNVKVSLTCAQQVEPFFETRFGDERLYGLVKTVPDDCSFVELALKARAWSGQSTLRGAISPLVIERQF